MISIAWDTCHECGTSTKEIKIDFGEKASNSSAPPFWRESHILTRRSARWSRPDVLSDDLSIEIDCPSIAYQDCVFMAHVTIKNNSQKSGEFKDLTLAIDPVCYKHERQKNLHGAKHKIRYRTPPQSPMSKSNSSSPPLPSPQRQTPATPDNMCADWISSFDAVCMEDSTTKESNMRSASSTKRRFVWASYLASYRRYGPSSLATLVAHWRLKKLQWGDFCG